MGLAYISSTTYAVSNTGVRGGGCVLVAATLTLFTLPQKQQSPMAMMTDRMKSHPTLVSFTGYQPPADEETAVQ